MRMHAPQVKLLGARLNSVFGMKLILCHLLLMGCLLAVNGQSKVCDPGEGAFPFENGFVCQGCAAGQYSNDNECMQCEKDTYQACKKQVECLPCPGGTSTKDKGNIACETNLDTNTQEYKREVVLTKVGKDELCGGKECDTGICASFDTRMRCEEDENENCIQKEYDSPNDNQKCPDYYVLSWSEIENIEVPNEKNGESMLAIVAAAFGPTCGIGQQDNVCEATRVFREQNDEKQIISFVGISTHGCGVNPARPTIIDKLEKTQYCIKKEDMPRNKTAVDSYIKSVSLEAVINKEGRLLRGVAYDYSPMWKTAAGDKETRCEEGMYLNNTSPNLKSWRCDICPEGAHCSQQLNKETLAVEWSRVKAKFGWYRLDPYDSDKVGHPDWPDDFEECANPESCLGAENRMLEAQYRDILDDGKNDAELDNVLGVLNRTNRKEQCNEAEGYRLSCGANSSYVNGTADSYGKTTKCLLCRACKFEYFPSGMRNCMKCPPAHFQVIGAFAAIGFLVATLYVFLKAALDTDASPHSHLAQPLQKIVLNHLQLISLASSFPLKWPNVITEMFDAFGMIARAGSFIFQPQCTRTEEEDAKAAGKSTFYQKQLLVLFLPFMALLASIVFWTLYEAKGFKKWLAGVKEERAEKRRIKPMTAAELFNRFHLFAVEDHKHDKNHEHKNRHKSHAHHDRLSHHGVHDLLFALCHDDRHPGLKKFLATKKKFDTVFQELEPDENDGKIEFHSLLVWYNERAKELMRKNDEKKKKKEEEKTTTADEAEKPIEPEMHDMAIHISNEALELHETLSKPVKPGDSTTIIRFKDTGVGGLCHLRDELVVLPPHPKTKRDQHGNLKKGKRKKKSKSKHETAKGIMEPGGLHCELRYSEVWGHGMELQQLMDSTVDVFVDGSLLLPGDTIELTSKSLIVISDTEILCDIVKHDMYKNLYRPSHAISKLSSKTERMESVNGHTAVHAPTREELQQYFMNARSHRKPGVQEPGLTYGEFHSIIKTHPDIFGHLWGKAQLKKCYNNMVEHVKDNADAVMVRRNSKKINKEVKESKDSKSKKPKDANVIPLDSEAHFMAFEEFAFHYFMERRHHMRKLQWARERHDSRRRTKTIDDRILKADAMKRMGYFDKVVATVITMIYLLYPTLCGAAFSMVACKQIGKSHSYLVQDLQEECFGPNSQHTYWFVFLCLPALITLVAGIPGIASYMLWRSRHKLHRRHIRFRFSILFIGYEDRAFYWEVVVAIRKLAVSAISVFLLQVDTQTQVLTAEIFVVAVLVLHLHVSPYIHVTPNHDTLQNVETFALSVSFITLVSGMLMFENSTGSGDMNQTVQHFLTFFVIFINAAFIFAAFYWWLTLKLMDLENVLEHKTTRQQCVTCCALCLKHVVPDWEAEGQELEIKREQAEAVEDLRHTNLNKLLRVQNVAHSLVVNFRARKLRKLGGGDPTKVLPVLTGRNSLAAAAAQKFSETTLQEMAASVEEKSEAAAKKFLEQMEGRVAKAHERLEARKRRRSSVQDPNVKVFVVPKGIGLNDLGFKLKVVGEDVTVYQMEFDAAAYRVGIRDGYKLIRAANAPVKKKTIISVLKSSPRPLKLVFKVKKKAVRKLKAAVHVAQMGSVI